MEAGGTDVSSVDFPEQNLSVRVEIADSLLKQTIGLSFRSSIKSNGMLFWFHKKKNPSFWMWGMRFPLDIIWIANSRVVGIHEFVKPERYWLLTIFFPFYLKRYSAGCPVDGVLEVKAGFCRENYIEVGNNVLIKN